MGDDEMERLPSPSRIDFRDASPPTSLGVIITTGFDTGRNNVIAIACARSIGILSRALQEGSCVVSASVVAASDEALDALTLHLESNPRAGLNRTLGCEESVAHVVADVARNLATSHLLIMNDSTILSREWIDSLAAHLPDWQSSDALFPTQHIRYGEEFDAVDYSTIADPAQLAAASPFTELLPPVGVVRSDQVLEALAILGPLPFARTMALLGYLVQQQLLCESSTNGYRLLAGSTFDRATVKPASGLPSMWSRKVGAGVVRDPSDRPRGSQALSWLVSHASAELQVLSIGGGVSVEFPTSLLRTVRNASHLDPGLLARMPDEPRVRPVRPSAVLGAVADEVLSARPSSLRFIGLSSSRLEASAGSDVLVPLLSRLQHGRDEISLVLTEGVSDRPVARVTERVFLLNCQAFLHERDAREDLQAFLIWMIDRFDPSLLNQGVDLIDDTLMLLDPKTQPASGKSVRYFPKSRLLKGSVAVDHSGSAEADRRAIEVLQAGVYDLYTSTPASQRPPFIASLAGTGAWLEPPHEANSEAATLFWLLGGKR